MKTESENSENVAAIMCEAVEIESAEERDRFLDEACAGDEQLRARVDELIGNHLAAGSFLNHPAVDAVTHVAGNSGTVPHVPEISLDFLEPSQQPGSLGRLGQYEILTAVGRGGMGIVLKAQDTSLNRIVAVKVLAPELASNATARMRFLREGQAAAAVSHDHVVTIHAVEKNECPGRSEHAGHIQLPYLVMEYIDGQSLQQKIDEQGPLELKEILRIGRQIAAGLSAAHDQGLIHRDVKPSNILLQNGVQRVQITDFGLARAVDDVGITRTGEVTGTPQYMSPEQAQGHPVDGRSDVFSLGSVMYAMCTGRSPFRAETSVATLRRVCDDTPRPIREVNPDIPDWLIAVIDKLLAKDPDERFRSAAEVARLLEQYLAHLQQPSAVPAPPRPLTVRLGGRRTHRALRILRTPAVIASLFIAAILLTGFTDVPSRLTELASTVIRVFRGDGTLEIRVNDPDVSVSVDGNEIVVTGAGPQEIRVTPGRHEVEYRRDGEPVQQQHVSIERGGRKVVEITVEPAKQAARTDGVIHELVWTHPGLTEVMSISRDGRFAAFRDRGLVIHDLNTREERRLTANGPDGDYYTTEAVFSPEGQWLAYNWSNRDYECELHVIRIDGSAERLVFQDPAGQWVQPRGWTPDGQEILCRLMGKETTQIVFVSVANGSHRVVKTLPRTTTSHPLLALSPDGRYIAYEIPAGEGQGDASAVYVLSADGSREYSVSTADDVRILGWPDGERLLVWMNRLGVDGARLIRLSDGRPYGNPELVREGLNRDSLTPGQFTVDGAFYYVRSPSRDPDELWVLRNFLPVAQPEQSVVWSDPQLIDLFSISPDESQLAFRDGESGDLAVRSLSNGAVRRLSQNGVAWEGYPDNARFSPNGRLVACEWRSENGRKTDLRVFSVEGGEPRVLYTPDGEAVLRAQPQDWSPDGGQLLVRLMNGDSRSDQTQIALISLDDGEVQVVKHLRYLSAYNFGSDLRFSPDGRFIAYEFMPSADSGNTDIGLISVDGQYESVLISNVADDDVLDWSPDGSALLFSRRAGRGSSGIDAWLIDVKDGEPLGQPRRVMAGVGFYGEFAADGTFYDVEYGGAFVEDVYVATLDPEAGGLLDEPVKASKRFPGQTRSAAWSPEGRSLAYYASLPDSSPKRIVIRSTETGEEREIMLPNVSNPYGRIGFGGEIPHWSPDGKSLLLEGFDQEGLWGIYRLNVQTGEVTTVETGADKTAHLWQHGWSLDGSEVVLRRASRDEQTVTQYLLLRNLENGRTTELHQQRFDRDQTSGLMTDGEVSPDGSQLALLHETTGNLSLLIMPMTGGEPQELYNASDQTFNPVSAGRCLAWTPDGQSLIFSQQTRRRISFDRRGTPLLELWWIPAEGGEPEPLGFAAPGLLSLSIHPDGRHIAYTRLQWMQDLRATELLEGGEGT